MPLYEYQCKKCGKIYEAMHKVNDPPPKICKDAKCGGDLVKIISETNFHLKEGGVGWAKDRYSGPSNKKPSNKK